MNNIAPKAPLARQANRMAGHGRYGDSQLVHMNPYEVQGLASMSPTGQLTTNPMTGQPEAFLPFLAPLLAPMLGSALGGTLGAGTVLGTVGGSALGSGLATWAATGDFEKGVVSGLTGFGLGQAMKAGADVATGATKVAQSGVDAANTAVSTTADAVTAAGQAMPVQVPTGTANSSYISNLTGPGGNQGVNIAGQVTPERFANAKAQVGLRDAQNVFNTASRGVTPSETLASFGDKSGLKAMAKTLATPAAAIPTAIGVGVRGNIDAQENMEAFRKKTEAGDRKYAQGFKDVLTDSMGMERGTNPNPYAGRFASGGIAGMYHGGATDEHTLEGMTQDEIDALGGGSARGGDPKVKTVEETSGIGAFGSGLDANNRYFIKPKEGSGGERQSFLKGDFKQQPPTDYRHGFEKEFQFFDFVEDRPIDRYLDTFGSGPSDYMAGLLGVDLDETSPLVPMLDDDGNQMVDENGELMFSGGDRLFNAPTAAGTNSLNTYDTTKADQFSGIENFTDQGLTDPADAAGYTATIDTVAGDGEYGETKTEGETDFTQAQLNAQAEAKRLADIETQRLADLEAKRLADIEAKRLADIEAKRLADLAAAAEKKRLADLAEKKRLADIEAKRLADIAAAAEAKRLADLAFTDDLDALGIEIDGDYNRDEGELVYDVMQKHENRGADVASFYGVEADAVKAAEETIAARRVVGEDISSANEGVAIAGDNDYTAEEINTVFNMLKTGDVSLDAASDYFDMPVAEIEKNMAAIQKDQNKAELEGSGTNTKIRSIEEIEAIAQGITDKKWTVEDVASQFSVPVEDVQAAYDSIVGQAVAQGGRLRNRKFMTGMGPIELAAGGIADIPLNLEMTQEMPSAPAMIEEEEIMQEVDNTDFPELIEMTIEAIKGNLEEPDAIIEQFIEAYGVEEFGRLRDAVLQSIVPDAVTEGMIPGSSGGMDDEVMGMIGEDQQVAVSPGEYIVAADVVSGLGDGSSDAGSAVLDQMMDGVRKARTGGRQPSPIDKSKVLPA